MVRRWLVGVWLAGSLAGALAGLGAVAWFGLRAVVAGLAAEDELATELCMAFGVAVVLVMVGWRARRRRGGAGRLPQTLVFDVSRGEWVESGREKAR